MDKHKYRYELAEEILARGGTNEEIQSRILMDFPNSRKNPMRAQWYRRSWNKHDHINLQGDELIG